MARDEAEEERDFLADLKARTGRTLADWMAAITSEGFADKNDAIDWLRSQGLPFARASWLERIHSNGGRPIYGDQPPRDAIEPSSRPVPVKPAPTLRVPSQGDVDQMEKLLAAAKGYRPLYQMLEALILNAVPGATLDSKATHVSVAAPREFAAVTLHATELRLGLDLGERPFDALLQKSRLKGAGPSISHMLVLTDARQLNADLSSLVAAANARING